jgi:hypothetical protein
MDTTFNECQGGYALEKCREFDELVADAFRAELQRGRSKKSVWSDPQVSELWHKAVKSDSGEDISLDPYIMTTLIIRLIADAGGDASHMTEESGLPGFTSTITILHAKKPAKVFDAALSKLRVLLRQ